MHFSLSRVFFCLMKTTHSKSRFLFTIPSLICLLPNLCHYLHVHINLTPPLPSSIPRSGKSLSYFSSHSFPNSSLYHPMLVACVSISSSLVRFSFTRNHPLHFFTHFPPCLQLGHTQSCSRYLNDCNT
jgi:hypothetical protein